MKHRRQVDILADVLAAAGNGTRKTRIMQQANLSYELLKKYLTKAVSSAFLQSNNFEFELTKKGQKFLKQYRRLHKEHSNVENILETLTSKWQAFERTYQIRTNEFKADNGRDKKNLRHTSP